jgi:hypothetical protein
VIHFLWLKHSANQAILSKFEEVESKNQVSTAKSIAPTFESNSWKWEFDSLLKFAADRIHRYWYFASSTMGYSINRNFLALWLLQRLAEGGSVSSKVLSTGKLEAEMYQSRIEEC